MRRQIILASVSPRRRELMKLLKIKFKAVESGYEEVIDQKMRHEDMVKFLALGKARAAAKKYPKAIIIAADTIVSFNGKAIGKPKDKKDVVRMLKSFSNKIQYAVSGMAVLDAATKQAFTTSDKVKIKFKKLSEAEILKYSEFKQALDKAGGYGPLDKGLNLINELEGDYTTAIGMNMEFVINSLFKLGAEV